MRREDPINDFLKYCQDNRSSLNNTANDLGNILTLQMHKTGQMKSKYNNSRAFLVRDKYFEDGIMTRSFD